jgi:hypothetical protein
MFEFTLSCKHPGKYVCPPDAGPAWRAATESGWDMRELEDNLRLTPWERLLKHDQILNEWLGFEAFMEKLEFGWKLTKSQHGNLS